MAYNIRIAGPLGPSITKYDRELPPNAQHETSSTATVDQTFIDAMTVREEVFVKEQGVPLENELDDDDANCIHIVLYADRDHNSAGMTPKAMDLVSIDNGPRQPVGTIRIIPAQDELHTQFDKHRHIDGTAYTGNVQSSVYHGGESFILLGRLAVRSSQRGRRFADALVNAAMNHAATNPQKVFSAVSQAIAHDDTIPSQPAPWRGLVQIHAQKQVQKFWAKFGFETDEGLGTWDEEGIDHVAMWSRIALNASE